jgi:hypothetical protein
MDTTTLLIIIHLGSLRWRLLWTGAVVVKHLRGWTHDPSSPEGALLMPCLHGPSLIAAESFNYELHPGRAGPSNKQPGLLLRAALVRFR